MMRFIKHPDWDTRPEPFMDALALRKRAEDLYRSGQFLCSEAVVYTFNEALDDPMPAAVVRLASGFPVGMGALGTGGCTCGALAGGVMVLGMVYGRSEPGGEAPLVLEKAKELHDWFKSDKRSTCCRALIAGMEFGSPTHIDQCVTFTGDVAERLALMLDAAE
ncbi:MAG TPA: C-GCAxxG-C-C family protein [Coriobacteriia bacterium]